ncbi:hypothetical protein [Sulfitobacter geojensis]|uniref:hypothetical protein n=1 Tax=Sulfitobacter geojensis TaxID=1342299 RepID=UPI0036DA0D6B
MKAPKRAKIGKNRVDDTRDSFKIAGLVGHDAGNLENTGKISQSQPSIKLLGKYPITHPTAAAFCHAFDIGGRLLQSKSIFLASFPEA